MIESNLLEMVAAIYDAATNPPVWPVFFRQYSEVVAADYVCIQVHDFRHCSSLALFSHGQTGTFTSYREHYNQINLWRERGKRLFQTGQIVPAELHTPVALLESSEFYNDFLRPAGIKYSFNAVLHRDEASATVFSVSRGPRFGACDDMAEHVTRALLPHLMRACAIQQWLAALAAGEELINGLPVGVIFLAADRKVLFANHAAKALLFNADAVSESGGVLRAADTNGDAALQHAVREAAAAGNSLDCPSVVLLHRRAGHRPYQLLVSPLRRQFPQFVGARRPAVVVFITDPERTIMANENLLWKLFGLTRSESRVASLLLNGRSTSEVAAQLGVQENTVRAHLKAMFAKTDTRSQAELIRLLATSSLNCRSGNRHVL